MSKVKKSKATKKTTKKKKALAYEPVETQPKVENLERPQNPLVSQKFEDLQKIADTIAETESAASLELASKPNSGGLLSRYKKELVIAAVLAVAAVAVSLL